MYKINCGVKPEDGVQIEFDDIQDFYAFDKKRKEKQEQYTIRGYIKSINVDILYFDEYNNGMYCWYVVNGKFLNALEPLDWHPLEDYIEKDEPEIND